MVAFTGYWTLNDNATEYAWCNVCTPTDKDRSDMSRKFKITDHEVDIGNGPTEVYFTVTDVKDPNVPDEEYNVWELLQELVGQSGFNMSIEELPADE